MSDSIREEWRRAASTLHTWKRELRRASTTSFYEQEAKQYFEETLCFDLTDNIEKFLALLPDCGHILDLGCGSGRDSLYFINQGYKVTAIDASEAMSELASDYIGQQVEVMTFQDVKAIQVFDGIWACASLLHCPKDEMEDLFPRLINALKPGGIWYLSLKYGEGERYDDKGRYFSYYTCDSLRNLVKKFPALRIIEIWEETRVLRGKNQTWVNALLKRKAHTDE